MSKKTVLWLGYGDIAQRAAAHIVARKVDLTVVSRTPKACINGVQHSAAAISDAAALGKILSQKPNVIVMSLTPTERSEEGYTEGYLNNVKALLAGLQRINHKPEQIIYISSSSVYHQQNAELVDENSVTEPISPTAQILLQTEQLLVNSAYPHCIVRFSGIYGPGRTHLIRSVLAGNMGDAKITNRIHSEDCAAVIDYLIGLKLNGRTLPQCILASDCEPVAGFTVRTWLACELGVIKVDDTASMPIPAVLNRKCNNALLLSLGYQFIYPSYKDGFSSVLNELDSLN